MIELKICGDGNQLCLWLVNEYPKKMLVKNLRKELQKVFKEKIEESDTDFENKIIKEGLGVFPYGSGLLDTGNEEIPQNGILILGYDFGGIDYFKKIKNNGEEKKPTLKGITEIISEENKNKVFLSNVFMGLRRKGIKNMEKLPGLINDKYVTCCKAFLEIQLENINPKLIIILGNKPYHFLNKNFSNLNAKVLKIPHPGMWNSNLPKSEFKNIENLKVIVNSNF
ncbi:MAG: uracil-DNA glycosylase family protein [Bacteroidota bacterium]